MADIELTSADNGGCAIAAAGDVIVVRLPENPTTGFRWQVDAAAGLRVLDAAFVTAEGGVGAGGEHTFRFEAPSTGRFSIDMSLRRVWEAHVQAQSSFRMSIKVR